MKSKLVLLLPIRIIAFTVIFLCMSAITNKNLSDLVYTWSIVASIVNILLILLLLTLTKVSGSSFLELINYQKGNTKTKDIIIISLIVICLGMGGMYISGLLFYQKIPYMDSNMIAPIPLWLAITNFFVLPISTAIAEDGLYLGCGVNNINNKYLKVIIPGFFFALQHSFIPFVLDIKFMGYRFLCFLPLTILLSFIYSKKKNPMPIMLGHALIDVFTVVWILITSINPDLYQKLLSM